MTYNRSRSSAYLAHYGVPGMKWGVRKDQRTGVRGWMNGRAEKEKAFRQKLRKIQLNKKNQQYTSDMRRFSYRNHPLPARVAAMATAHAVGMYMQDYMTGQTSRYLNMSKNEVVARLTNNAVKSGLLTVFEDMLAKSAAKNYDDKGNKISKVKQTKWTKQDKTEWAMAAAAKSYQLLRFVAQAKMIVDSAKRAQDEARMYKWGGHLLKQGVGSLVYAGEGYEVLDPYK